MIHDGSVYNARYDSSPIPKGYTYSDSKSRNSAKRMNFCRKGQRPKSQNIVSKLITKKKKKKKESSYEQIRPGACFRQLTTVVVVASASRPASHWLSVNELKIQLMIEVTL